MAEEGVDSLKARVWTISGLIAISLLVCFIGIMLGEKVLRWLFWGMGAVCGGVAALLVSLMTRGIKEAMRRERAQAANLRQKYATLLHRHRVFASEFERERLLANTFRELASTVNPEELLDRLLRRVMSLVGARVGYIMIPDERGNLRVRASSGEGVLPEGEIKLGEGLAGRAALFTVPLALDFFKGKEVRLDSLPDDPGFRAKAVGVPLVMAGERIAGVMVVEDGGGEGFDRADLSLLELIAAHAAVAVERAGLYKRIEEMAVTDQLTGLANRRHLEKRLEEEMGRARRYGTSLSAIMFDIDCFKEFNDTYGHLVGDSILREVAYILRTGVRRTDIVARYGGEEFCLILPDCKLEEAVVLAERLRAKVESLPFKIPDVDDVDEPLRITVSAGVATFPDDALSEQKLLDRADEALYEAKRRGRNCVVSYREVPSEAEEG